MTVSHDENAPLRTANTDSDTPTVHYTGRALLNMPPQQVYALFKLRVDVFIHERRATFAEIDEVDAHPETHHVLAYIHPGSGPSYPFGLPDVGSPMRLVGTARVFGPAESQHIGRVCVAEDMRGYGIGHQLLQEALDVCTARAAGIDPTYQRAVVKLEVEKHFTEVYASYGFEIVGEPFDVEGIEHVEMHKTL